MTDDTIGIDISKATLDIHRLSDGKAISFSNCPAGFKALSRFCAKTAVAHFVYEATMAYHGGLERALGAHLPLVKVNPLQAPRFAQAQGVRAKQTLLMLKCWPRWEMHLHWNPMIPHQKYNTL